jgi:YbbR domain-containing protein
MNSHNLSLRLLSVFLAFTLWFVVSAPRREPVSERAFAAPVSIVRMPRDLVITTPVPDSVSVRLRGRVSDLRSLSSQNLEVTLDVSWVTPGDAVITLSPQAMSVPPQIDVVSMEPMKLRFRVEALRQTVVPIRPFLIGQPPPGYVAGDPTLVPDHALVSGRSETFLQNVAVVSDSSLVRIIEPLVTQATVPVNPEIGPVAPVTTSTETTSDTTSEEKPAESKPPAKTPADRKRRNKRER